MKTFLTEMKSRKCLVKEKKKEKEKKGREKSKEKRKQKRRVREGSVTFKRF